MLSPTLLELLRDWYRVARPQGWLFPGQNPTNPITTRQLTRACHADGRPQEARDTAYFEALCRVPDYAEHWICRHDAANAMAICEAVRRQTMRFVGIKTAEQQGQLMQHRTRDLPMRQLTQLINALRAHLAELGIVAAQGNKRVAELLAAVADERDPRLPIDARASVIVLATQLEALQRMIGSPDKRIKMQHRTKQPVSGVNDPLAERHGVGGWG